MYLIISLFQNRLYLINSIYITQIIRPVLILLLCKFLPLIFNDYKCCIFSNNPSQTKRVGHYTTWDVLPAFHSCNYKTDIVIA